MVKVNIELETFLYRSAHDLKRPLTSIIGLADIAKLSMGSESQELFERTKETASDMSKLLDKLQIISHINHPVDFTLVNFSEVMNKLMFEFKDLIDKNNIDVSYKIEDNINFNSHPALLQNILTNLFENAVLYSTTGLDKRSIIKIKIYRNKSNLCITITDNGEGISEGIKNKIWNMFYRGNAKATGNGLGLYIAKKAVSVLKGSISYQTKIGECATFKIQLPFYPNKTN